MKLMRDVSSYFRRAAAAVALALFCLPAHAADPLTILLLRLLRDKIISAGIESAVERGGALSSSPPPDSPSPPGTIGLTYGLDHAQLRQLIDEGFVHLSASQRAEVYESVRRILADPKNAADVPAIIADLAIKASAVRQAHEQLSLLSATRKRQIAAEARGEYERMAPDTRDQMASVLRQRLVPLPADLNEMILSEFDSVRAATAATPPGPPVVIAVPAATPAEQASPSTPVQDSRQN